MHRLILLLAFAAVAATAADAAKGKELYLKYSCYACHSFDGHGGAGARLVPMKLPLAAFTAYVRNPRQMPSYSTTAMPVADLADVWSYLKTLPDSPAVKDIPLLRQLSDQK